MQHIYVMSLSHLHGIVKNIIVTMPARCR